jgi:hypothetical protein
MKPPVVAAVAAALLSVLAGEAEAGLFDFIYVTSPKGGEVWAYGSEHTIAYSYVDLSRQSPIYSSCEVKNLTLLKAGATLGRLKCLQGSTTPCRWKVGDIISRVVPRAGKG